MARGDFVSLLTANMVQNATLDRQPGSGVDEMLVAAYARTVAGAAPYSAPQVDFRIIDGTNNDAWIFGNSTSGDATQTMIGGKFVANNTNYFRMTYMGATTGDGGFQVVVV